MMIERYGDTTAGSRTLVLSPSREVTVDRALLEMIAGERPQERSVLSVTYARTAESFVEAWREHVGAQPRNLGVIDVDAATRSASTVPEPESGIRNVVVSIADPSDLPAVVDTIGVFLDDWGDEGETIINFDSLTKLLYHVGIARSIGFVDDLGDRLESRGCTGYFRLEKYSHDAWIRTVLGPLFDSILELSVDGEAWSWTALSTAANGVEGADDDTDRLSLDRVFDVLGPRDRRLVIHTLRQSDRAMRVSEIAERIVALDGDSNREVADKKLARTYVGLRNVHFPKLEQAGIISVDPGDDTVELLETARRVDPFLALTVAEDLDV